MTREAFFAQFGKHLLVGGLKREEILIELWQHLNELPANADPVKALGEPRILAHGYDRVHLGLLGTRLRLFLAPIISVALVALTSFGTTPGLNLHLMNSAPTTPVNFWAQFTFGLASSFSILMLLLVSRTLAHMERTWTFFVRLIPVTLFTSAFFFFLFELFQNASLSNNEPIPFFLAILGALMIGIALTFVAIILCVIVIMGTSPIPTTAPKLARYRRLFDTFLAVVIAYMAFLTVSMLTAITFAPFDGVPPELRPPEGTLVRELNDFFEKGFGYYLFPSIAEIGVLYWLWKRFRRFHQKEIPDLVTLGLAAAIGGSIGYLDVQVANAAFALVALFVSGLLFGYFRPDSSVRWGITLGAALLMYQMLFVDHEFVRGIGFVGFLPAILGSFVGARLHRIVVKRSSPPPIQVMH